MAKILTTPTVSITIPSEENSIKKEGYLLKESRWMNKTRKRYCLLMNGAIYAYKSHNCTICTESFNLITAYKHIYTKEESCQFILSRSPKQKLKRTFTANSVQELHEWVQCISNVQLSNSRDTMHEPNTPEHDLSPLMIENIILQRNKRKSQDYSEIKCSITETLTINASNSKRLESIISQSYSNDSTPIETPIIIDMDSDDDEDIQFETFIDTKLMKLNANASAFEPTKPETVKRPKLSPSNSLSTYSMDPIKEIEDEKDSYSECITLKPKPKLKKVSKNHGKPQYFPPKKDRAQGHIHIPKDFTGNKIWLWIEKEQYRNLYDYMDKSTAIPGCRKTFLKNGIKFGVINYGFCHKDTREVLYCVINAQNNQLKQNRNYLWKMVEQLYTAKELLDEYKIRSNQLPKSLALQRDIDVEFEMKTMEHILATDLENTKAMIRTTRWPKKTIFNRVDHVERMTKSVEKNRFITKLTAYYEQNFNEITLVPILMFDARGSHWIEYVWIVSISEGVYIGISLKYNETKPNKMEVNGIHLDKEYLLLQHQLVPWVHDCHCLDEFKALINDYHIGNPDDLKNQKKNLEKQLKNAKVKNETLQNKFDQQSRYIQGQKTNIARLQRTIVSLQMQQINIVRGQCHSQPIQMIQCTNTNISHQINGYQ